MPSVEIHSLAWPNTNPRIVKAHSDVCEHFGIKVTYTFDQVPHGAWMNTVMMNSTADIVGFLDIDCIPTDRASVDDAIEYVEESKSFVGIAQVSNHIPPASHIYAAPAFFFIWRETWLKMGTPTFTETGECDVAENVSYAAEYNRLKYRTLFPQYWTLAPDEGLWPLHTYGVYGIGTVFESGVYHLYQSRKNKHAELFLQVCDDVMQGNFVPSMLNKSKQL